MSLTYNIVINFNSILLLLIIFIQSKKYSEVIYFENKLFSNVVLATIILLIVDTMARFDGFPETVFPIINHTGNFLLFVMAPVLPSMWLVYAHYQVFQDKKRTSKLLKALTVVNTINIIVVIMSLFFGWYYYIDKANIYHRGEYYVLSTLLTISLLLVAFIMIIKNRSKIEKKYYVSLLFFSLPPLLGMILQVFFYGISFVLTGVVLSIVIVFINIQNENVYTDYLTEASNRRELQIYMTNKIKMSTSKKTFSAIMLDLDDFKNINDSFGHKEGDFALQETVRLIKNTISFRDLIARSGGDEFWIVLETCDKIEIDYLIGKIKQAFQQWNKKNDKPYQLNFSYGVGVYDYKQAMNLDEFQKYIDDLMYENKQQRKQLAFDFK